MITSESDKITLVQGMCGEEDVDVISAYLYIAGQKILRRAFPYDRSRSEVPEEYTHLQLEATVYLLNKRGAEGEASHTENGVSRSYENADLPDSMLREIIPMGGLVS